MVENSHLVHHVQEHFMVLVLRGALAVVDAVSTCWPSFPHHFHLCMFISLYVEAGKQ